MSSKILIVDDEAVQLSTMALILGREHEVVTANSGPDALEKFVPGEFAVVVSDLKMPGCDGIDLLEQIADRDPTCARILLTAFGRREAIIDAVNRGKIYMFLDKPCDPGTLKLSVQRAVERWNLQNETKRLSDRVTDMEKVATAGRFASCVGHDIRNYLVPVLMACEETDPNEIRESLETARNASEAILALVSEMQALAKGGKPQYTLKSGAITNLLIDSKRWLERSPIARSKDLVVEPGTPCNVLHCEASLRRVFVNLMKNALEATGEQTRVKVIASHDDKNLKIDFIDEGQGMSPEIAEKCFDPFFSTKGDQGTGLGLYICRTIIDGHNGQLSVKSTPKQGTCFTITLPLAQT
ncbi:MAG: hybrid sensor histidine kinase/response regulator [Myxococcota bacterium]|nr:hybrid sensor histidine kinase/response regulator [Myxococcota bacterium]